MVKINLMPKKTWKTKAFKAINIVAQVTLVIQMSSLGVFLVPQAAQAANPSANLDQCANDPAPSPSTNGCSGAAGENGWVNGNLNQAKSVYYEGDSIPYRMLFENLSLASHTVTIEWDTTKSGKHAIDYITTYNRTVATANPCLGVSGCSASTTYAIPADPQVTGAGVTPIAGNFTLFGGTITGVSAYSYPDGTGFAGDKSARITLTFTPTVANPVLAWGGHISHRQDWGTENSAVAIPGSPYHTRLIDLDGSGGNQDRSLSAEAVIYPASITIVKDAVPNGSQSFAYATTGGLSPANFSLVDDGTAANTRAFTGLTNFSTYTVTESPVSGWDLNTIACSVTSSNGGSQTVAIPTVTINLKEGENVTCTFTNDRLPGSISGYKWKDMNGNGLWDGGEPGLSDWQINLGGDTTASTTTAADGSYSFAGLNPGSYTLSETQKANWIQTYPAGNLHNVTLTAGQNVTGKNFGNEPGVCNLLITKKVSDLDENLVTENTASVGETLTYTINYSNPGTAECTGTGVKIFDALDSRLTYTGWHEEDNTDHDITFLGGLNGTDPLANAHVVSPGESGFVKFKATINQPEVCGNFDIPNKARIWSNETGFTWSNEVLTHVPMECYATLKVIKHVINDNGGNKIASDFTMNVTGNNVSDPSFPGDEAGTEVTLTAGSYSVDEDYMAGYAKSFSGDCSGTIANGDYKVCTITNNDIAPKLKLIKHVINDNGGNKVVSDFPLFIDATQVTSGQWNEVTANVQLTASETQNSQYTASAWSGDCSADGTITLQPGDQKVCEITNDDKEATLTLIKLVTNDNGGNKTVADFPLFINATQVTSGVANSVQANTLLTASETQDPGYQASAWSGDCAADGTITLLPGDNKVCEITNDDIAPKLKLVKTVINDNGGNKTVADFPLFIDATQVVSGQWNQVMANVQLTASETEDPGYDASEWTGDCNRDGTITLQPGDEKVCYITNDDIQPQLTVYKYVINDFGGTAVPSDFTMNVTATNPSPSSFPGNDQGTLVTLDQGFYDVTEDYMPGYTPSYSADCTGTINVGESKTCVVTNSDQAAHLIVIKHVINDDGGNNVASDFVMHINGVTVLGTASFLGEEAPGTDRIVHPGTYNVTEDTLPGYADSYSADCSGSIALGETKICTVTNDDEEPSITLYKEVINNNGGQAGVNDFGLSIGGTAVNSGDTEYMDANTPIALDEVGLFGYNFVEIYGDAKCPAVLGGTVELDEGEHVTCTIKNDDIAPELTVIKHVINNHGGTLVASNFTINVTGTNVSNPSFPGNEAGTLVTLNQGSYSVDEGYVAGYQKSLSADCSGTINVGESKTCTITNDDIPSSIAGEKWEDMNGNGARDPGDNDLENWHIFIDGNDNSQYDSGERHDYTDADGEYQFSNLSTGNYIVCEEQQAGWLQTFPGNNICWSVQIFTPGTDVTGVDFGNSELVSISGYKYEDHTANGSTGDDTPLAGWTIHLWNVGPNGVAENGANDDVLIGTAVTGVSPLGYYEFNNIAPGTYYLMEDLQPGWIQTYGPGLLVITSGQGPAGYSTFGNYLPGKISGYKLDAQEQPLAGWEICYTMGGVITPASLSVQVIQPICTYTDANGYYEFTGLMPGDYTVFEDLKYGWTQIWPEGDGMYHETITSSADLKDRNFKNRLNEFEVEIEKTGEATVSPGDQMTYTLNWTITGNTKVYNAEISDVLPDNTTFVSADNGGVYDNVTNTVTWNLGDVTPLVSGTVHFTVSVASLLYDGTIIDNTGEICAEAELVVLENNDLELTRISIEELTKKCDEDDHETTVKSEFNVQVDKNGPLTGSAGEQIDYTVDWSASGNSPIDSLIITDTLPAETTFVSASHGGVELNGVITWDLGPKNPPQSGSFTVTVTLNSDLEKDDSVTNDSEICAWVTEAPSGELLVCDEDDTTTKIIAPILTLEKTVDLAYANPGNVVTYTVVITNTGNETAYNVVMTDTLPDGFTYVETGLATRTWSLGDLEPGDSVTVNYEVTVGKSVKAGFYDNIAEAEADNHGKVSDIATVEVRIPTIHGDEPDPVLSLVKTVDKEVVNPNSLVNYTVTINNNGEGSAEDVVLTDNLPEGFTFTDTGLSEKTWEIGLMLPGSSLVFNYEVKVGKDVKAGKHDNLAVATSSNHPDVSDTATVEVKVGKVLALAQAGMKLYKYFFILLSLLFVSASLSGFQMIRRRNILVK